MMAEKVAVACSLLDAQGNVGAQLASQFRAVFAETGAQRFYEACALLNPHRLYFRVRENNVPPLAEMCDAVNFEIPPEEWDTLLLIIKSNVISDPILFWQKQVKALPRLCLLAKSVFALPTVATDCDSVLSVEEPLFASRSARMSNERASIELQMYCNGDVFGANTKGKRAFMTSRIATTVD
jgi:hypothetical protein